MLNWTQQFTLGLDKKKIFGRIVWDVATKPYILRLIGEFINIKNEYPKPEDQIHEIVILFDDIESQKKTIMHRMGIHGNVLTLFSRIIKAFPSAKAVLTDGEFQKFTNNPNFRPILYSGIILKVWRKMTSVYQINPVYIPLLSLEFANLSELNGEPVLALKTDLN